MGGGPAPDAIQERRARRRSARLTARAVAEYGKGKRSGE
jgi:hypothetical protein